MANTDALIEKRDALIEALELEGGAEARRIRKEIRAIQAKIDADITKARQDDIEATTQLRTLEFNARRQEEGW